MKKRKVLSVLFSLCMVLGLVFSAAQPVEASDTATTNQAILDARNGVLEIVQAVTLNGELIAYGRGTGFLVGSDNGAQTVITNHHVANSFPHDEAALRSTIEAMYSEALGEPVQLAADAKLETEIRVIVKRDVYITADIVNESEAGDFSILKLEQPIYDRQPLTFGDSSTATYTQQVYALGFPAAVEGSIGGSVGAVVQIDAVYTADDVTVTNGIVSKISQNSYTGAPISTILHSATISGGNSGGPLVDANGYVIGLNTYGNDTYFYSTEINEVADILTALGIEFEKAGSSDAPAQTEAPEPAAAETTAPEAPAETQAPVETENPALGELKAAIDSANAVALDGMSEDSADNFRAALNAAESVYRSGSASDAEIRSAISDLDTAKNGLVEAKDNTTMIIIIAAVAVVVIIVIVIIIVVSSSKKKKKAAANNAAARNAMNGPRPNGPVQGMPGGPAQQQGGWNQQPQQPSQRPAQQPNFNAGPAPFNAGSDGSAETSVLNDGAGETTILGGGSGLPAAYLVRKKNNERITINKQVFKLGKERRRVDYCVSDNTNVSRTHADIVYKNGSFYIVDNNATNGTVVNGSAVAAGQERKLSNGDTIKLADEEFRFQM